MRPLIIGPLPPEFGTGNPGGVAHHVWQLSRKLAETGIQVDVLVSGRFWGKSRRQENVQLLGWRWSLGAFWQAFALWVAHPRGLRSLGRIERSIHFLNMAYRVALAGPLDKYDLCHIHGLYNEAIPVVRALAPGLPTITTIHSYHMAYTQEPTDGGQYHEQPKPGVIADQTELLKSVDLLAHVSVADRNKGRRLGVRWSCPEVILHNGVDFPENRPFDTIGRERSLVFVGGLIPRKRIGLTLEAVALVANKAEVRLHVAGDGPERQNVEEHARAVDWCSFHGPMPPDALRALLRRQAVMVVPSQSESFGLVYIEAISEGMAVIGFDQVIREFREILECDEAEKALLVPFSPESTDPEDLASQMEALLDFYFSPQGQAAVTRLRGKAQHFFGWPNAIKSVTAAYKSVITNNAGSRKKATESTG